jgi:hypothetical protein
MLVVFVPPPIMGGRHSENGLLPTHTRKLSFKTTVRKSYHCYTAQAGGGGNLSFVSFAAAALYTTFCTTF